MALQARVVNKRRATITELPLYYSGHLLKKLNHEQDFTKYYGELRGAALFLYKDDTQATYMEKLDLEELKSMDSDSPRTAPIIFKLTLPTEELQLKIENADAGEEWRAYILTVVKKKIPSKLHLLPGQQVQLQEVLDQERRRNLSKMKPPVPPRRDLPSTSPPPSPPTPQKEPEPSAPDMPECFFDVSREEAEKMLEENPDNGGIILRPSTMANNYALTLRHVTPSGPVMKNFRVTSTKSGFVIKLDTAVTVSSLNDVLQYFLEQTEYRVQPYTASQHYDTRIDLSPVPKCISITSGTHKTVPKAQVAPMQRSQTKPALPKPPEDGEYVIPDDECPKLKLVHLDKEFQEKLKIQRGNLYTDAKNAKEEVPTYANETPKKSSPGAAWWSK